MSLSALAPLALVVALCACTPASPFDSLSSSVDPTQVFEAVKPAVVIVETDDQVTWSVPQPALTAAKESQLRQKIVAMVRAGQVANNETAIGQASVKLLVASPDQWFTRGAPRHQQTDTVLALGSGFFVTEDGYLFTNDHVVDLPADQVQQELLDELAQAPKDPAQVAAFRDEMTRALGVPFTSDQASSLFQWMVGVYRSDLQIASIKPAYRIGFGSMSIGDVQTKGVPVQLVAHGAISPGRDAAVLKAPAAPYVSLAAASGVPASGASLSVVGYPCRCGDGSTLDPTHILSPVLTQGSVRGQVAMSGGWSALATDAHMERGNSGGPVLDDHGDVVGLATFTAQTQAGVPQGFAVPVDVASQLAGGAHVRPAQGVLGRDYAAAVADYRAQHYREALPLFQLVAARAHDPYAQRYVGQTQQAIELGEDRTPSPVMAALPGVLAVLGGAILITLLAAALLLRLRSR